MPCSAPDHGDQTCPARTRELTIMGVTDLRVPMNTIPHLKGPSILPIKSVLAGTASNPRQHSVLACFFSRVSIGPPELLEKMDLSMTSITILAEGLSWKHSCRVTKHYPLTYEGIALQYGRPGPNQYSLLEILPCHFFLEAL